MRRKIAVLFTFLLLLGSFFIISSVKANISILPGKLTITMPEGYPEEDIEYKKIYVENHDDYDIEVVAEVTNPSSGNIEDGYSLIPDLSWVEISPELLSIPAKSSGYLTLKISIPKSEQALHFNEKWEVRVLVYKKPSSVPGTATINVKLASRIFIHTPTPVAAQQLLPPISYLMIVIIIGLIAFGAAVSYTIKKRNAQANRGAVYYVKKKKKI